MRFNTKYQWFFGLECAFIGENLRKMKECGFRKRTKQLNIFIFSEQLFGDRSLLNTGRLFIPVVNQLIKESWQNPNDWQMFLE